MMPGNFLIQVGRNRLHGLVVEFRPVPPLVRMKVGRLPFFLPSVTKALKYSIISRSSMTTASEV